MPDDASYICDCCGEEIVVPLDLSAGSHQEYVEAALCLASGGGQQGPILAAAGATVTVLDGCGRRRAYERGPAMVTVKADIAEVKPKGGSGMEIIEDYRHFLDDYAGIVTEDVGDRKSKSKHSHPWFGELNAHQ